MLAIQQLASVKAVPFGGYSQAERQRIVMGQPELVEALELDPSQVSSEHAATSCTDAFACMRKLCCEFEPDMASFAARLSHWSTEFSGSDRAECSAGKLCSCTGGERQFHV